MSSVRKRSQEVVRRSNRDRQTVYKSLDENILGIQKRNPLFCHILEEANNPNRLGVIFY